jgi:hypothetical protein
MTIIIGAISFETASFFQDEMPAFQSITTKIHTRTRLRGSVSPELTGHAPEQQRDSLRTHHSPAKTGLFYCPYARLNFCPYNF